MHMQSLLSKNDSNLNDYSAALHSSQMAMFLVTWLQAPPLSPSHHIQLRACPPGPPTFSPSQSPKLASDGVSAQ